MYYLFSKEQFQNGDIPATFFISVASFILNSKSFRICLHQNTHGFVNLQRLQDIAGLTERERSSILLTIDNFIKAAKINLI